VRRRLRLELVRAAAAAAEEGEEMAQPSKEPCKKEACDIQACLSKNMFDSRKFFEVSLGVQGGHQSLLWIKDDSRGYQ
ncbi:unnamed protein product, partial [Urochloa humidicola]